MQHFVCKVKGNKSAIYFILHKKVVTSYIKPFKAKIT